MIAFHFLAPFRSDFQYENGRESFGYFCFILFLVQEQCGGACPIFPDHLLPVIFLLVMRRHKTREKKAGMKETSVTRHCRLRFSSILLGSTPGPIQTIGKKLNNSELHLLELARQFQLRKR